jgi:hypothetical protein
MMIKTTSVKALSEYKLLVEFETGEKKIYDFSLKLDRPAFRKLKNPALFSKAYVEPGGVVWNDEIDIAAEELYTNGVPS